MSGVRQMEWRVCPRFPNFEVSEWGDMRWRVKTPHRLIGSRLKGFIDADGYLRPKPAPDHGPDKGGDTPDFEPVEHDNDWNTAGSTNRWGVTCG